MARLCRQGCSDPVTGGFASYGGTHCTHRAGRKKKSAAAVSAQIENAAVNTPEPHPQAASEPSGNVTMRSFDSATLDCQSGVDWSLPWTAAVDHSVPLCNSSNGMNEGPMLWPFHSIASVDFDFGLSGPSHGSPVQSLLTAPASGADGSGFDAMIPGPLNDAAATLQASEEAMVGLPAVDDTTANAIFELLSGFDPMYHTTLQDHHDTSGVNSTDDSSGSALSISNTVNTVATGVVQSLVQGPAILAPVVENIEKNCSLGMSSTVNTAEAAMDNGDESDNDSDDNDDPRPTKRTKFTSGQSGYVECNKKRSKVHSERTQRIVKYCNRLQQATEPYIFLFIGRPESMLSKNGRATCFQSRLMAEAQQAAGVDLSEAIREYITYHICNGAGGLNQADARAINARVDHALKEKEEEARQRRHAEAELAAKNRELEAIQARLAMVESGRMTPPATD